MNRHKIQIILDKYQEVRLYDAKTPILLAGYKSFQKPFRYKSRMNIIGIINARAYYVRMRKIMTTTISKALANPQLLNK